jgi:hypothetical protein
LRRSSHRSLIGASLAAPGSAHDSSSITYNWRRHYRPLAKEIFYTKRASDARFINIDEPATDSALLDGLDSTAFASASHTHSGDDITSGTVAEARIAAALARDSEVVDIVLAADGTGSGLDADLLDGVSSGAFEVNGLSNEVQWFKESADSLATTTTTERVVFTAPENITITDVLVEPSAAVTASDTNYATVVCRAVTRRVATRQRSSPRRRKRPVPVALAAGRRSPPSRSDRSRTRR